MNMEFQQYQDQRQSTIFRFDKAPVLYSLDHIDPFLQRIRESLTENPHAKTTLFITGESGSGKEITAGQLIYEILETNPDIEIGFLSLGMAMRAAKNKELAEKYKVRRVTRQDVNYDKSDYESASKMMNALIEDFYAAPSDKPKLAIIETVGYTYPEFDHGTSTIQKQMRMRNEDPSDRNVFLLGLIADDRVQDETFKSRNAAAQDASPEELNSMFHQQRIRRDVEFVTPHDTERFRNSRGTELARGRNRTTINNNILNKQKAMVKLNYFDGVAAEAIRNNGQLTESMLQNPAIRRSAHSAYVRYLADIVYAIEPGNHILIAENNFITLTIDIPYYVSLTEQYALVK